MTKRTHRGGPKARRIWVEAEQAHQIRVAAALAQLTVEAWLHRAVVERLAVELGATEIERKKA